MCARLLVTGRSGVSRTAPGDGQAGTQAVSVRAGAGDLADGGEHVGQPVPGRDAYLATQSGDLRPTAFLGETADKLKSWGARAADAVTEKVREIQADPLGAAVKGLAHVGTPVPEIEPAPRLHSDIVLDKVRQARDVIADPDAPLAARLILSQTFAAALVAAGLEQYVVNPVMEAPADVVDTSQLYAKAEAHIARGEYDPATKDLHAANAKLEQTANTAVDIATLGEGAAAGTVAKEGRLVNAEVHAAEAAKQAETKAARELDEAFKPAQTPQPGTYVGSHGNQAKANLGESTMGFAYGADGWAFLEGPSGAGGIGGTDPAPAVWPSARQRTAGSRCASSTTRRPSPRPRSGPPPPCRRTSTSTACGTGSPASTTTTCPG